MTPAYLRETLKQHSAEATVSLITTTHPDITTQRYARSYSNVTSRGNVYTAYPFDLPPPPDERDGSNTVSMGFSNIERRLIDELRSISGPLELTLEIVAASDPDTVQDGPYVYEWREDSYSQQTVTAKLGDDAWLDDVFPKDKFTPQRNPALFGRTE